MIYLIAILTGLVLGIILSPEGRRNYDAATIITCTAGSLLGVLFFINFLGIRLTVGFLWLEAILWGLLGALILRLVVSAFAYGPAESGREVRPSATAHEYRRAKSVRRRRRG